MVRLLPRRDRHTATTEFRLAQRWSEQLGVEAHPDDTFYDLGGSSLQVVDMLESIRNDWAVALTPADLVEHPTLREFAAHVSAMHASRFRFRNPTSVRLQTGEPDTHEPLFCVAGAGASSLSFLRLADALEPHVPVHSLQGRGVESRGWPDWSIRSAVQRRLREIRRLQPRGTYHLTGHSAGAIIALECARALRSSGATVAPLVLIDPPVPPRTALTGEEPPEIAVPRSGADSAIPPLRERLTTHARVAVCGLARFDVHTQQTITWEHGKRAMNRHRLRPFDHPTVVVLSQEYAPQGPVWRHITGPRTTLAHVGRWHNDILRDNAAAMLCADLITDHSLAE